MGIENICLDTVLVSQTSRNIIIICSHVYVMHRTETCIMHARDIQAQHHFLMSSLCFSVSNLIYPSISSLKMPTRLPFVFSLRRTHIRRPTNHLSFSPPSLNFNHSEKSSHQCPNRRHTSFLLGKFSRSRRIVGIWRGERDRRQW